MLPLVAEIVEVPVPPPVAKPVLLIVATAVGPEAHPALFNTCVLLSVNVPVAVNCCVWPLAIVGFTGVTAMDTNCGGVTVSVVVPVIAPDVAMIVEDPTAA